jgi:hypothetical protein
MGVVRAMSMRFAQPFNGVDATPYYHALCATINGVDATPSVSCSLREH